MLTSALLLGFVAAMLTSALLLGLVAIFMLLIAFFAFFIALPISNLCIVANLLECLDEFALTGLLTIVLHGNHLRLQAGLNLFHTIHLLQGSFHFSFTIGTAHLRADRNDQCLVILGKAHDRHEQHCHQ